MHELTFQECSVCTQYLKIHSVHRNKLSLQQTDQLVMLFTIGMTENTLNTQCDMPRNFF
jgi:hypothetical protein